MTPQELSDAIGAIYDCTLEPDRWPPTLEQLSRLLDSPFTFVVMHDVTANQPGRVFEHGGTEHWLQLYFTKYAALNPVPAATWLRPMGQVYTVGELFREEEWYASDFYKDWMRPQSFIDMMGLMVLRSGNRAGWLGATRRDPSPPFSQADQNTLRLLAPHICRAIDISNALDLRTITSDSFEATVDALSAGVFLLDGQRRVVYSNKTAAQLVKDGRVLRIIDGHLWPSNAAANAALTAAVSSMINASDLADALPRSIALPGNAQDGWIATALPVDGKHRNSFVAPWAAKVAVFVQSSASAPLLPGEAFARLYQLTGGELRVVMTMAPGLGIPEVADILGLSEATVKSHLKSAFQKTSTSKQAELVRLLLASSPPVRP